MHSVGVRRGMAWRQNKISDVPVHLRNREQFPPSSQPSAPLAQEGKSGSPSAFVSFFSSFLSSLHLFASRARSCNSGKLVEAQRCLVEPRPARPYLPEAQMPRKDGPANAERVRNRGGGNDRRDDEGETGWRRKETEEEEERNE